MNVKLTAITAEKKKQPLRPQKVIVRDGREIQLPTSIVNSGEYLPHNWAPMELGGSYTPDQ